MVISLNQCIARPNEGDRIFPLHEHLEAVASDCGDPYGTPEARLAFLAGLLHDAGKAHVEWQEYIRGRRARVPHAPLGSALFAFCADCLISSWTDEKTEREHLQDVTLDWVLAVYDHHGRLDDLDTLPPWEGSSLCSGFQRFLNSCDTNGLFGLVAKHFPGFETDGVQFQQWLGSFAGKWERRFRFGREKLLHRGVGVQGQQGDEDYSAQALRLPQVAARLIRADRYHAGKLERAILYPADADSAAKHLEIYCRKLASHDLESGADPTLVEHRGRIQLAALDEYRENHEGAFFTLLLPTGYGKTLTSLRVALEACCSGSCERIIYVAPYISILSQAAYEMSTATGLEVFQHHHLSLAELADDEDVDVLDTWQTPVLATTFNQFFRALFPNRAQECLRIDAIRRAFIIVDEPQIVETASWNLFLRGLAVATREWKCKILFATATLPPIEEGLSMAPISLAPKVIPSGRFTLTNDVRPLTAAEVADRVRQHWLAGNSIAVVFNTVQDAVQMHNLLKDHVEGSLLHCLTAVMLPGHKAAKIQEIREQLAAGEPVVVVCTQILEAGVNLSFRVIFRALSVLHSLVQVAGRANRHGEGERAIVTVFPFLRDDGNDSRLYVYRDETARRQTDTILTDNPAVHEEDTGDILQTYFERCWAENRYTACLVKFEQAARGSWSALAGLEPFGSDASREDVFVPVDYDWVLSPKMKPLIAKFAPKGPTQLLKRYCNASFRRGLTFHDRKRLQALIRQYTVPVPRKVAQQIADQVTDWLWQISNLDEYSPATGLAHLLGSETGPAVLIL